MSVRHVKSKEGPTEEGLTEQAPTSVGLVALPKAPGEVPAPGVPGEDTFHTPTALWLYLRHARTGAILSAPLIYLGLIPFLFLDLFLSLYQAVCFPIYGIPLVRRRDYIVFDRGRLRYLNLLERLNCSYCSYANGLLAYSTEIAARTEQHWCPIKHAHRPGSPHSRYAKFVPYGDPRAYRDRGERVRRAFEDLS